jgi:hypothetical protein
LRAHARHIVWEGKRAAHVALFSFAQACNDITI